MSKPVTVKRFAEQIHVSQGRLLQQIKNAGVLGKTVDSYFDETDKTRLLHYLRQNPIMDENEFKRCSGYKGHHECADEYPDNMVPVSGFGIDRGSKDGLHHMCRECMNYRNAIHANTRIKHPLTGENKDDWKRKMAISAGGVIGTPEWKSYLEKADAEWGEEVKGHLLNTAPAHEVLEFMFPETKESVVTQSTVNHKTRNKPLYTMLKELYNYTCQVEGCNETEVEVAHIYKHSLPDSVDNETNTWCLCRNHHRAYDTDRMIFNPALNGRFIRYDVFGKVYEIGRIIYDEKHTIDVKWIKKSREYHDSKK